MTDWLYAGPAQAQPPGTRWTRIARWNPGFTPVLAIDPPTGQDPGARWRPTDRLFDFTGKAGFPNGRTVMTVADFIEIVTVGQTGPQGPQGNPGPTGPAGPAGSTAWAGATIIDFTSLPNTAFSTDTTYTFDGLIWTKYRSVNDASPLVNTNGTGLVIQPGASSAPSANALGYPRLAITLSQLIPNIALDWPLRISARVSGVTSGADVRAILGLETVPDGGGGINGFFLATKGQTSEFENMISNNVSSSVSTLNDSASYSAYDTLVLELPGGIAAAIPNLSLGAYSAGFPANNALFLAASAPSSLVVIGGGKAGLVSNWEISLGAQRSGTSTNVTFTHLRVEYLQR